MSFLGRFFGKGANHNVQPQVKRTIDIPSAPFQDGNVGKYQKSTEYNAYGRPIWYYIINDRNEMLLINPYCDQNNNNYTCVVKIGNFETDPFQYEIMFSMLEDDQYIDSVFKDLGEIFEQLRGQHLAKVANGLLQKNRQEEHSMRHH